MVEKERTTMNTRFTLIRSNSFNGVVWDKRFVDGAVSSYSVDTDFDDVYLNFSSCIVEEPYRGNYDMKYRNGSSTGSLGNRLPEGRVGQEYKE